MGLLPGTVPCPMAYLSFTNTAQSPATHLGSRDSVPLAQAMGSCLPSLEDPKRGVDFSVCSTFYKFLGWRATSKLLTGRTNQLCLKKKTEREEKLVSHRIQFQLTAAQPCGFALPGLRPGYGGTAVTPTCSPHEAFWSSRRCARVLGPEYC